MNKVTITSFPWIIFFWSIQFTLIAGNRILNSCQCKQARAVNGFNSHVKLAISVMASQLLLVFRVKRHHILVVTREGMFKDSETHDCLKTRKNFNIRA